MSQVSLISADTHVWRCMCRYNIVVDGNGAPDRLALTMCAGSVVLKATLFKEWYYDQLRPDVHYLPIQLDYSDLTAQLDWAKDNQDKVHASYPRGSWAGQRGRCLPLCRHLPIPYFGGEGREALLLAANVPRAPVFHR